MKPGGLHGCHTGDRSTLSFEKIPGCWTETRHIGAIVHAREQIGRLTPDRQEAIAQAAVVATYSHTSTQRVLNGLLQCHSLSFTPGRHLHFQA
jgi:hypothetical protein